MVAVQLLSGGWAALFYGIAVLLFLLGAFGSSLAPRVNLVALGLALFAFVFFWNALART
jgi:hypothetical protein